MSRLPAFRIADEGDSSPRTRWNPPGRSQLRYKACAFRPTAERLLAGTRRALVRMPDGSEHAPLAHLNVEEQDDWTVALLYAWATNLEVLSFYQERIANEGYLRTATQRRSVIELLGALGQRPMPALSARTLLVLQVTAGEGGVERRVDVPRGMGVQSIPESGGLPQVFESDEGLSASSFWNRIHLRPDPQTRWSIYLERSVTRLRVDSSDPALKSGSRLLIVGESIGELGHRWRLVQVTGLRVLPDGSATVLEWDPEAAASGWWPRGSAGSTRPAADPPANRRAGVFLLDAPMGLHAHPSSGLAVLEAGSREWAPTGIGLPASSVNAMGTVGADVLLAGTLVGPYRSSDGGRTWLAGALPMQKNFTAIEQGETGSEGVLAATEDGEVYRSRDLGRSWQVRSGEPRRVRKWLSKLVPHLFASSLPKTVVRAVLRQGSGRWTRQLAATDDGLFLTKDGGRRWRASSLALPDLDWIQGTSKLAVSGLCAEEGRRSAGWAATERGVLPAGLGWRFWLVVLQLAFIGGYWLGERELDEQPWFQAVAGQVDATLEWTAKTASLVLFGADSEDPASNSGPGPVADVELAGTAEAPGSAGAANGASGPASPEGEAGTGGEPNTEEGGSAPEPAVDPGRVPNTLSLELAQWVVALVVSLGAVFLAGRQVFLFAHLWRRRSLGAPVRQARIWGSRLYAVTDQGVHRTTLPSLPGGRLGAVLLLVAWIATSYAVGDERARAAVALNPSPDGLDGEPLSDPLVVASGRSWYGVELAVYFCAFGALLLCATAGFWRRRWTLVWEGAEARCVGLDARARLLVGLSDGSVRAVHQAGESDPEMETAEPAFTGTLGLNGFLALEGGLLSYGAPGDAPLETRWSARARAEGLALLDAKYPVPREDSWLVAEVDGGAGPAEVYASSGSFAGEAGDRVPTGRLSCLRLSAGAEGLFETRRDTVLLSTAYRRVAVLSAAPFQASETFELQGAVPADALGRRVVLTGKRLRCRRQGKHGEAEHGEAEHGEAEHGEAEYGAEADRAGDSMLVTRLIEVERGDVERGDIEHGGAVEARDRWGERHRLERGEVLFEFAFEEDELVSVPATITLAEAGARGTRLGVTPTGDEVVFDRATVSLYGNALAVSHGASVESEPLTPREEDARGLSFELLRGPLTCFLASDGDGVEHALEVDVLGVRWSERQHLVGCSGSDRVYRVQQDGAGRARLHFGDGAEGARPARIAGSTVARYRVGSGPEGNIPRNQLRQPINPPAGIGSVTNPLEARGGTAVEDLDQARRVATKRVRTLGRIVTLGDVEDFAAGLPGVECVQAARVALGERPAIVLSVVGAGGRVPAQGSPVLAGLMEALAEAHVLRRRSVVALGYEPVPVEVEVELHLDSRQRAREQEILAEAEAALLAGLGHVARTCGAPLCTSDVIGLLQPLRGVVGVLISGLRRLDAQESAAVVDRVECARARVVDGDVEPAQLLLLQGPEDVHIEHVWVEA